MVWAKAWLGIDGTDPSALHASRRAVEQRERMDKTAEAEDERKRKNMMAIWLACQDSLKGTPVEAYLNGRGVPLDVLGLYAAD